MSRLLYVMPLIPFIVSCASQPGPQSVAMTAHASFGCSSTDYKDSRFQGSTNDNCGYEVVGRVGGGVMNPLAPPEKGEPVDNGSRPDNTVELELGYVRHGDMNFNGLWQGVSDRGTVKADGTILGLVYTRKVTQPLDLFIGAGVHHWNVKESEIYAGIPERHSASGSSPYYQLGGRYWFNPHVAARISWERFTDVGKRDQTGVGDIDNWWLGLDYRF